jgi:NAD-dependent dihydropyrimidine dehydrogenase PreA subunit
LFHYEIDPEACTGCHVCFQKCPQEAVSGDKKKAHAIHQEKCIKCGICYDGCKFDAIKIS